MINKVIFLMVLLACLAVAGMALAQVSQGFDLSWHVMGNAGPDMASADHRIQGTLGQVAIGPAQSVGTSMGAGYWYGIRREMVEIGYYYLPNVLRDMDR